MQSREERMEENERNFRDANERLHEQAGEAGVGDEQLVPFLCECADETCLGRIQITLDRFAEIHVDRDHFVILPGHLRVPTEEIIEVTEYYEVTEKAA
jgi:hypothetical protein